MTFYVSYISVRLFVNSLLSSVYKPDLVKLKI